MRIKIKKLSETAIVPTRGSDEAAGYDLYADIPEPVEVKPHSNEKIGTGLAISVPSGYFGGVFARSGLAAKQGLRPSNCVGCIDSDYTGEIIVVIYNDSDAAQIIRPKERIAQLVIIPYLAVEFDEADELDQTERGEGGFGSTGI